MFSPRKLTTAVIIYGRTHESIATRKFQEVYDRISVSPTGLFIHPDHNFLAASLDGKMGLDTLLEIKCPYSGREEEIDVGPHFPFLEMRDGELALKKSHNYFYQCQGQMLSIHALICSLSGSIMTTIFFAVHAATAEPKEVITVYE